MIFTFQSNTNQTKVKENLSTILYNLTEPCFISKKKKCLKTTYLKIKIAGK